MNDIQTVDLFSTENKSQSTPPSNKTQHHTPARVFYGGHLALIAVRGSIDEGNKENLISREFKSVYCSVLQIIKKLYEDHAVRTIEDLIEKTPGTALNAFQQCGSTKVRGTIYSIKIAVI